MIIDAHTHLGKPGGALNARAEELLKSMDEAKIDKSLVFAGRLNGITTKQVMEECWPWRDRLHTIASVSPGWDKDLRHYLPWEWQAMMEDGFIKGIKFYPGYEPFHPYDEWLRPWCQAAQAVNLPVIFHAGDTYSHAGGARLKYALPIHIDELAVDMPDLKIVIAHMGYPWQREAAEVVYKNKNVYADCSGFVYGNFDHNTERSFAKVLNVFIEVAGGYQKLMFGSDFPISNQASYLQVLRSTLDENTLTKVLCDTAKELFHL
jgi:uncharacterized protein